MAPMCFYVHNSGMFLHAYLYLTVLFGVRTTTRWGGVSHYSHSVGCDLSSMLKLGQVLKLVNTFPTYCSWWLALHSRLCSDLFGSTDPDVLMKTMIQFQLDSSGQGVVVECKLPVLNPLVDAGAFPGQFLSPSFLFSLTPKVRGSLRACSIVQVEMKPSFAHTTELATGFILPIQFCVIWNILKDVP